MIKFHKENGNYVIHLTMEKWTHNTKKAYLEEAKRLALQEGYPLIWCQVPPEKARFMEYLGCKFIRNRLIEDGIIQIYCLDTGVFKDA